MIPSTMNPIRCAREQIVALIAAEEVDPQMYVS
jgi:hypothetical protein